MSSRRSAAAPRHSFSYAYDLGDRVTQIIYPSGRIVQYGRDTKGRVTQVQTKASASVGGWTALAGSITYEPFAAVKAMVLGERAVGGERLGQ